MPTILASILLGVRRRRADRILHELGDHLLRDIGVDRQAIGRSSVYRTRT